MELDGRSGASGATIDSVADELYRLDPGDFVEVRKARVAQARKAGDRELANAIGQLRKPTVVAWTVNLLAHELPEDVEALLQLGEALRSAQRSLSGPELRKLNSQRQAVVRALADRAGELAAERGQQLTEGALREVGQSLHAALADPTVAEQVRLGRLVVAATYSGFGPSGLSAVDDEPVAVTPQPEPKRKRDKSALLESAEAELAEAEEAVATAQAAAEDGRTEADDAEDRVTEIEDRIAELKEELERADQERRFALGAKKAADDQLRTLDRDVERAEKWAAKVRGVIDALS